ncbi:unnamed protein product [Citrullus colocynthis]|uniref:Uncharacterized protein n=1 Tax=Citrullus colocynthis TaxID=252529 RepID=A0ABP0YNZ3_9ROSI
MVDKGNGCWSSIVQPRGKHQHEVVINFKNKWEELENGMNTQHPKKINMQTILSLKLVTSFDCVAAKLAKAKAKLRNELHELHREARGYAANASQEKRMKKS